jgi:hypothetical protein
LSRFFDTVITDARNRTANIATPLASMRSCRYQRGRGGSHA